MRGRLRFREQGLALLMAISIVLGSSGTVGLWLLVPAVVRAEQNVPTPAPCAPYAFLIGEWDVGVIGGKTAAVARFRWDPTRTYIWYSGALLVKGKEEPAYEGLLVWNGVRKNLDMLLVLEPTSGNLVQEQGTVRIEPDGTVVREITAYYSEGNAVPPTWDKAAGPEGASAQFRHTFKADGPDRILSTVMRKTENGWVANFPGSDHLVMTRRGRDGEARGSLKTPQVPGHVCHTVPMGRSRSANGSAMARVLRHGEHHEVPQVQSESASQRKGQ